MHTVRDTYAAAFDGLFTGPALQSAARTLTALGDALTPFVDGDDAAAE